MRRFGLALFATSLILIPELAIAGGTGGKAGVPELGVANPGTVTMIAAGLLGLACVSGTLTLREIIGRRPKFGSKGKS